MDKLRNLAKSDEKMTKNMYKLYLSLELFHKWIIKKMEY